jgi:hypothetical protein
MRWAGHVEFRERYEKCLMGKLIEKMMPYTTRKDGRVTVK